MRDSLTLLNHFFFGAGAAALGALEEDAYNFPVNYDYLFRFPTSSYLPCQSVWLQFDRPLLVQPGRSSVPPGIFAGQCQGSVCPHWRLKKSIDEWWVLLFLTEWQFDSTTFAFLIFSFTRFPWKQLCTTKVKGKKSGSESSFYSFIIKVVP